jgi:hypothetical protein
MAEPSEADALAERRWFAECRGAIDKYLQREGIAFGAIDKLPSWSVAPYVSIWAIADSAHTNRQAWWVICGDLPTDYISALSVAHPRHALRLIAHRWLEVSAYMLRGQAHPSIQIGSEAHWPQLGPLLKSRAETLFEWADDDDIWSAAP